MHKTRLPTEPNIYLVAAFAVISALTRSIDDRYVVVKYAEKITTSYNYYLAESGCGLFRGHTALLATRLSSAGG